MEVEEFPKRSERRKRKTFKYLDENSDEEHLEQSSHETKEILQLEPIKKKRGRKPKESGRNIKQKVPKEEVEINLNPEIEEIPFLDITAAILKGLRETSKIPLNDHLTTKSIGFLCKVFWDQDNVWYTGRVLLFDPVKNLHFIYFEIDGTAEWIDTSPSSEDYVLLADEFVLFGSWPAMKYIGSAKGLEYIRLKSERSSDTYVEYFPHTKSITTCKHAFTKQHELRPIDDFSILKSRKKLRYAAEQAQAEFLEFVADECRKLSVCVLGDTLVGAKISFQCSDDITERICSPDVGTIVEYCPGINEYFVLSQDLSIKPKWMKLQDDSSHTLREGLTILIDWDHLENLSSCPAQCNQLDSGSEEDIEDISKVDGISENNDGLGQTDHELLSNDQLLTGDRDHMYNGNSKFPICHLCRLADVNVVHCPTCLSHSYHPQCMPLDKIGSQGNHPWKCWHCIECEGCHRSAWITSLNSVSLNELLTQSLKYDRDVLICDSCEQRYRHGSQDYCQICCKLYSSEDDETSDRLNRKDYINAKPNEVESDENQMIQCNECHRWIHCKCEGIDQIQYNAIAAGSHPVWGDEFLCPKCRIDISTATIDVLYHADVTQIFGEPVSVEVAKSYYEIIRNPMDLSTMYQKAQNGIYKSLQSLRDDFELMCLNAITFNKVGDEYWIETTEFFTRGFHYFEDLKRNTHISAYGIEYQKKYQEHKGILKTLGLKKPIQKSVLAPTENPYSTTYTSKKRVKPAFVDVPLEENSDYLTRSGRVSRKLQSNSCENPSEKSNAVIGLLAPQSQDLDGSELIPSSLASLPHGSNEIFGEGNLLYPSDSFYFCCLDICGICSSYSSPGQMLFCIDCGESYHSFCVQTKSLAVSPRCPNFNLQFIQNLSLRSSSEIQNTRYWRCANCSKFCSHCHMDHCDITCKMCNFSFHKSCLSPLPKSRLNFDDFTCSQCIQSSCQRCESKSKRYASAQVNANSPMSLEFFIGKRYFCHFPKWGVKDTCIECLCADSFNRVGDLLYLSKSCSICNQACQPTSNDEGESNARQCIGCFKFFHLECEKDSFNDFFDLQTLHLEYLCSACAVDFFASSKHNSGRNIDFPIYKQLNTIQLQRLDTQTILLPNNCSEPLAVEWNRSFSASLHSALIIWAAKRYLALSQYSDGPIILSDNSVFRSREHTSISTTKTIVKARKFARLCECKSRLTQLSSGGIYFGNENKKRPASNFFELAVLAASFLLVTTRELNNAIRSPISIEKLSPVKDTKYLQVTHWKVPPEEAVNMVSEHLHDSYPQEKLAAIVMEKILVEWKRLVISEYYNGFPTSPATSPLPSGTQLIPHEIPSYELNYNLTPLRSLIGARPLIYEAWQHSSLISHAQISHLPTPRSVLITSQPVVQTSVPASKEGAIPPKVKTKFVPLSERELKRYFRDQDIQLSPIFTKLMPHNPTELVYFNNYWVCSSLVPEEEQPKLFEQEKTPQVENVQGDPSLPQDSLDVSGSQYRFHHKWRQISCCILCKGETATSVLGPLLLIPSRGLWIHSNCLKCSEGVYETDDGVLEGIDTLLKSRLEKVCSLCGRKGASIRCDRKYCNSVYHLECAIACQFAFKEVKQDCELESTGPALCKYKVSPSCVVHKEMDSKRIVNFPLEQSSLRSLRVGDAELVYIPTPQNTLKLVATSKSSDEKMKTKSRFLRTGSSYREGALTIHKLGSLSFELPGHHSSDCIFPFGFRSTRIFWSMIHPYRRAVYHFEIQSEDFEENNPFQKLLYPVPLFVVTVSDQYGSVFTSRCIHDLYQKIITSVLTCQPHVRPTDIGMIFKSRSKLYPHNPYIFFGVGINVARYAIETQSESLAMMVPSHFFSSFPTCDNLPRYRPRYHLPTLTQFREAVRRRLQHRHITRKNIHGSSRAEGYIREKRFITERKVRNLAKAVDDNGNNQSSERLDGEEDDDENENLRKKSRLEAKYRELSEGYLINPFSKLIVKRSEIHGWGLFAKVEFPKDAMVVEYIGEKVRQIVADIREETYDKEGVGSCYLFRLDKDNIIDATRTGGMARFMNHCCEPNAYAKIITCSPRNQNTSLGESSRTAEGIETKHIVIFANRTIQPGEEITYDYKFPIEENKLKCYCGAPKCQGTMN